VSTVATPSSAGASADCERDRSRTAFIQGIGGSMTMLQPGVGAEPSGPGRWFAVCRRAGG
jgi:hypothetical protein